MKILNKNTPPTQYFHFPLIWGGLRESFWFTLVELIVVISILAILWTIAFLSFNNYSSSARDSQRISDTTNLKKWLDIYQAQSGFYPMPEWSISTWVILSTEVTYMWTIQDQVSNIAKISKTPKDPSTNNPYIYWITYDKKQYQIALALENSNVAFNNQQNLITQTTYAANEQARVIWNYLWSLKFKSWATNTYIANVPSLIYNFSWSVSDLITNQSQVYFVINKNTNLPYKVKADSIINNKSANQLIQELTNSWASTLTGVNITSILSLTDSTAQKIAINNLFTGSNLTSFNLNWLDPTNSTNITTIQSQIQSQVLGTVASTPTTPPTPTYTCSGTLVIANANITNNTNLTQDTAYQTTNSANNCYYTCKTGYSWTNCEIYTDPNAITSTICTNAWWDRIDSANDMLIWSTSWSGFCISPTIDFSDTADWLGGISFNGWWYNSASATYNWWDGTNNLSTTIRDTWEPSTWQYWQTKSLTSPSGYTCASIWSATLGFTNSSDVDNVVWQDTLENRMRYLKKYKNTQLKIKHDTVNWVNFWASLPVNNHVIPAMFLSDCLDWNKDLGTDMTYKHSDNTTQTITYATWYNMDVTANTDTANLSDITYQNREKYLQAWTQESGSHLPSAMPLSQVVVLELDYENMRKPVILELVL